MDFGSEQASCVGPAVNARASGVTARRPPNSNPLQRLIDITLAASILLFLSPLFLTLAAITFCTSQGPIFFGHERVGLNGRPFRCWKFRSMVMDAEGRLSALLATSRAAREEWARDHKLRSDPRVTPFGQFLRRSSLDELPQLWNVVVGEMSLVGPRPIVKGEVAKYGRRYGTYCSVKPGLTGLWQVSGRSDANYGRRVALDCLYVRRKSLMLDVWILIATVPAVILAKGSY